MTTAPSPAEIERALAENCRAPSGPARNARAEELAAAAERSGDRALLRRALGDLVEAYAWSSESSRSTVPFARLLQEYDRDPSAFQPWEVHTLFWSFKWVTGAIIDTPEIPLSTVERWLDDMERRYRVAGYTERAVRQQEFHLALTSGDDARADRAFAAWRAAERDVMTNCHACELGDQGLHWARRGDDERALETWRPVLDGMRCKEEPHRVLGHSLLSLVRLGRTADARAHHLRGYRLARGNDNLLRQIGEHLEFCALTGNEARGLEILAEHADRLGPLVDVDDQLAFTGGVLVLLRRLRELGHGDRPAVPYAGDLRTVDELSARLHAEAAGITARYDARNGSTVVSERFAERTGREPLLDALPLGLRSTPLVSAGTVPGAGTQDPGVAGRAGGSGQAGAAAVGPATPGPGRREAGADQDGPAGGAAEGGAVQGAAGGTGRVGAAGPVGAEQTAGSPPGPRESPAALARRARERYAEGCTEEAERAARAALEQAAAVTDPEQQADVRMSLAGILLHDGGAAEEAAGLALEAAHWFDEAGRASDGGARARMLLARAYAADDRHAEAAEILQSALPDLLEQGPERAVQARELLGGLLRRLYDPRAAAEQFLQAAETARQGGDPRAEARQAHAAGEALTGAGLRIEAKAAYERALELWRRAGDVVLQVRAMRALAWLERGAAGDEDGPQSARALMDRAAALLGDAEDPALRYELGQTWSQTAELLTAFLQDHDDHDEDDAYGEDDDDEDADGAAGSDPATGNAGESPAALRERAVREETVRLWDRAAEAFRPLGEDALGDRGRCLLRAAWTERALGRAAAAETRMTALRDELTAAEETPGAVRLLQRVRAFLSHPD